MAIVARVALDRRLSDRHGVNVSTTLRTTPPQPRDTAILELSVSGCRFIDVGGLKPDDHISLGLPGLGIRYARIVRVADGQCACAFDKPLNEEQLATILVRPVVQPLEFPASELPLMHDSAMDRAERAMMEKEPDYPKWPIGYRMLIIVGSSIFLWGVLIAIAIGLWALFTRL